MQAPKTGAARLPSQAPPRRGYRVATGRQPGMTSEVCTAKAGCERGFGATTRPAIRLVLFHREACCFSTTETRLGACGGHERCGLLLAPFRTFSGNVRVPRRAVRVFLYLPQAPRGTERLHPDEVERCN